MKNFTILLLLLLSPVLPLCAEGDASFSLERKITTHFSDLILNADRATILSKLSSSDVKLLLKEISNLRSNFGKGQGPKGSSENDVKKELLRLYVESFSNDFNIEEQTLVVEALENSSDKDDLLLLFSRAFFVDPVFKIKQSALLLKLAQIPNEPLKNTE